MLHRLLDYFWTPFTLVLIFFFGVMLFNMITHPRPFNIGAFILTGFLTLLYVAVGVWLARE